MPAAVTHHHRPTTKVTNKAFKSRAASKHELRDRAKGMYFVTLLFVIIFILSLTLHQAEFPTKRATERLLTNKSCQSSTDATRPSRPD
jgi:hypothetical protein